MFGCVRESTQHIVGRQSLCDYCKSFARKQPSMAAARKEHVASDVLGFGTVASKRGEGRLNPRSWCWPEDLNLQSHCIGGVRYGAKLALGGRGIGRIDQHGDPNGLGDQLEPKCQPFRFQLTCKKLIPVGFPPGGARLATRPSLTGSSPTPKTIGIVVVAALAT